MLLNIHHNLLLEDLKEHFSKCFPSLKIEFYRHPHHWKKQSGDQDQLDDHMLVSEVLKSHEPGILQLKSTDTTADLETLFRERFGMNVQLFWKGRNGWVQATHHDNYTLQQLTELSDCNRVLPSTNTEQAADLLDLL